MKDDSSDIQPARVLARRLIEQGRPVGVGHEPSPNDAAAALDRLHLDLARWVGLDGSHALFTRALAQSQEEHRLLAKVKLQARSTPYVEGVEDAIEKGGAEAAFTALESLVVKLIDLLGRLIGYDMATKLIARGLNESGSNDGSRDSGGTTA